jgi:hypothetical protein
VVLIDRGGETEEVKDSLQRRFRVDRHGRFRVKVRWLTLVAAFISSFFEAPSIPDLCLGQEVQGEDFG